MTYKNQYAVAVIQDGKIVPEQDGGVTLPYGSEYKVRLKNKSRQKSVADVYIDGKIACKGIIVGEDVTVDLERYIRPEDSVNAGPKFKLARLSHPGVSDANDDQNGLLEVRFYKELPKLPKQEIIIRKEYYPYNVPFVPVHPYYPWDKNIVWCSTNSSDGSELMGNNLGTVSECSCDTGSRQQANNVVHNKGILRSVDTKLSMRKTADGPAATVEGSLSNQKFVSEYVEVDTTSCETLTLKLFGVTRVKRLDRCECGHRRKNAEQFCPKCGERLVFQD